MSNGGGEERAVDGAIMIEGRYENEVMVMVHALLGWCESNGKNSNGKSSDLSTYVGMNTSFESFFGLRPIVDFAVAFVSMYLYFKVRLEIA